MTYLGLSQLMHISGSEAVKPSSPLWSSALMTMLLGVSISDMLWRRVSNAMCLSGWLLGLCLWAHAFGWRGAVAAFCGSVICLILGLLVYAFGKVGAADAKVLAAYGACVGPGATLHLMVYGALFAGGLGLVALYQPGPNPLKQMAKACLHPVGALRRARKNGQTMPLTVALSGSVFVIIWGGQRCAM